MIVCNPHFHIRIPFEHDHNDIKRNLIVDMLHTDRNLLQKFHHLLRLLFGHLSDHFQLLLGFPGDDPCRRCSRNSLQMVRVGDDHALHILDNTSARPDTHFIRDTS